MIRFTSMGLALIAGLFGATLTIAEDQGVREAIRFERAKEAAARAQARKERPAPPKEREEGVAGAIRFERMKDTAAAAQARQDAGVETASRHQTRRAARRQRNR